MATVKKLIGRLPVYKGDWVAGTYSMLNQVSYLGSTFQSKIDNNTSQPATLVNNVLQVNSNWNVISNGTAAYVANDRLTACETASTYAQAGVDTLRSEISGLKCTGINSNYTSNLNISNGLSACAWIDIPTTTGGVFMLGSSTSYGSLPSIYAYYNGTSLQIQLCANNIAEKLEYRPTCSPGSRMFIAINFFRDELSIFVDGKLVSTKNDHSFSDVPIKTLTLGSRATNGEYSDCTIRYFKIFNHPLTQSDVDALYNQGRCDKVVIGDEWRGDMFNQELVSGINPDPYGNYLTNASNFKSNTYVRANVEFENKSLQGNQSFWTSGYPSNGVVNVINGVGYVDVLLKGDNSSFLSSAGLFKVIASNRSIIHEYLPKYLTKTKWIDSGANKQDITLTSPKFTYIKPYKDVEFAEGAPTTSPAASGCMRIDRTNKRAYLSILK